MRQYEVLMILPPDADEQVVVRVTDRMKETLAARGGEVGKIDRWGRKRLGYEIARQSEGYYVLVDFQAEPPAIAELDRVLSLADDVLRFKVVQKAA